MEVYGKVKGFFLFSEGRLGAWPEFKGKNVRAFQKNLWCLIWKTILNRNMENNGRLTGNGYAPQDRLFVRLPITLGLDGTLLHESVQIRPFQTAFLGGHGNVAPMFGQDPADIFGMKVGNQALLGLFKRGPKKIFLEVDDAGVGLIGRE
jgi:hypothetical protein